MVIEFMDIERGFVDLAELANDVIQQQLALNLHINVVDVYWEISDSNIGRVASYRYKTSSWLFSFSLELCQNSRLRLPPSESVISPSYTVR
jgi:hypothetical protein